MSDSHKEVSARIALLKETLQDQKAERIRLTKALKQNQLEFIAQATVLRQKLKQTRSSFSELLAAQFTGNIDDDLSRFSYLPDEA